MQLLICILFTTFIVLQVYDFWSTYRIIVQKGGEEKNKILNFFMKKIGVKATLVLFKALALSAGVYLSFFELNKFLAAVLLSFLVLLYGTVMFKMNSKYV